MSPWNPRRLFRVKAKTRDYFVGVVVYIAIFFTADVTNVVDVNHDVWPSVLGIGLILLWFLWNVGYVYGWGYTETEKILSDPEVVAMIEEAKEEEENTR